MGVDPVIGYASRTGGRRNLDALRAAGWRLLVSASGVHRSEGFGYAIDNGAWSAHCSGRPWDRAAFVRCLDLLGRDADWVVAPDVVLGGPASLDLSLSWLGPLLDRTARVLLAVQDGHTADQLAGWLGPRVGLFVGGSTRWKEQSTLAIWGPLARSVGCWLHVGRVNTARRISICSAAGASSFDGTSATKFSTTLRALDAARRQTALEFTDDHDQASPDPILCRPPPPADARGPQVQAHARPHLSPLGRGRRSPP